MQHCAHKGGVIQVGESQFTSFVQEGVELVQEYCCSCGTTRWEGELVLSTKKHGPYLQHAARTHIIIEAAAWSRSCPKREGQA